MKKVSFPLVNICKLLKLVWQTSFIYTIILGSIALLQGILPVINLWIGKLIIDSVVSALNSQTSSTHLRNILMLAGVELIIVWIADLLGRSNTFVSKTLSNLFEIRINTLILNKTLELDLAYYETPSFHDILQRARTDAGSRPVAMFRSVFSMVQNLTGITMMLLLVIKFSWIASLVLILATVPHFFIDIKYSRRSYSLQRSQTAERRRAGYFSAVLTSNIKEVKLFGIGRYLIDRWKEICKQLYCENKSLSLKNATAGFLAEIPSRLSLYGCYGYVLYKAASRYITLGDMTMYVQAFRKIQDSFKLIMEAISFIYELNLYVTSFFTFLELKPKVVNALNARPFPKSIKSGIEFKNVSFRYTEDGEMILHNIEFKIRPGESIALVGKNGAGKTTIVKLLTRLYDPTEGSILIDGIDIKMFDLSELTQNIGVIFQDFSKYFVSAKENIGFGNVDKMEDMAQIIEVARKSGADKFINHLPHKYNTMLGKLFDGGVELSGGEWQKIALARAFMRDAQILILDEPTASLDAEAEYEIFKLFRGLTYGKITILISHRFSTVRMADRILVIEKGRIIEHGSHNELMELKGRYAYMFNLQARSYQVGDRAP